MTNPHHDPCDELRRYDESERRGWARIDGRIFAVSGYRRNDAWLWNLLLALAMLLASMFVNGCAATNRHGVRIPRDSVPLLVPGEVVRVCDPLVVIVDDARLLEATDEAVRAWERWTGVQVPFALTMLNGGDLNSDAMIPGVLRIRALAEWRVRGKDTKAGEGLGVAHNWIRDGCVISAEIRVDEVYAYDRTRADVFQTTLRHELGHVMGLGHSSWRQDLMYKQLDSFVGWHPMTPSGWERNTIRWLYAP